MAIWATVSTTHCLLYTSSEQMTKYMFLSAHLHTSRNAAPPIRLGGGCKGGGGILLCQVLSLDFSRNSGKSNPKELGPRFKECLKHKTSYTHINANVPSPNQLGLYSPATGGSSTGGSSGKRSKTANVRDAKGVWFVETNCACLLVANIFWVHKSWPSAPGRMYTFQSEWLNGCCSDNPPELQTILELGSPSVIELNHMSYFRPIRQSPLLLTQCTNYSIQSFSVKKHSRQLFVKR